MDAKGFRITGPPPRPDVAYRIARERAEAIDASITQALQQRAHRIASIDTRADQHRLPKLWIRHLRQRLRLLPHMRL